MKDWLIYFLVIQPWRELAAAGSIFNRTLYVLVLLLRLLLFVVPLCISFSWVTVVAFLVGTFFPMTKCENIHPSTTHRIYLLISTLALFLGVVYHRYELAMCLYSVVTFRYDVVVSYHAYRKSANKEKK